MDVKDLDNILKTWVMISCPQFEKMLWYNKKTGVYESGGKIIDKEDKRLLDYLETAETLVPVHNKYIN